MGQEQSLPQNDIENVGNNNLKIIEENINNKQNNKIEENENSTPKELSVETNTLKKNDTEDDVYKSPALSLQSMVKSYNSSNFISLNIFECLVNLCSPTSYPLNHEIWYNLLKREKIPLVNTRKGSFDLNVIISLIGKEINENNNTSRNFTNLIINLLNELKSYKAHNYKLEVGIDVRNSIYIIRLLSKYFIENLSNEQIIDLFNNNEDINKTSTDNNKDKTDNESVNKDEEKTSEKNEEINHDNESVDKVEDKNNENMEIIKNDSESVNIVKDKNNENDEEIKNTIQSDNKYEKTNLESLIEELFNLIIYLPHSSGNNIEFYEEVLNTLIIFSASRYNNDIKSTQNYILTVIFKVLSEKEDNKILTRKVITKLLLNLMYSSDQKNGLFARVLRKSSLNLSSISKKSLYLFLIFTNQPNKLAKNELPYLINEISNSQMLEDTSTQNLEELNLEISFQNLYTLIYEKLYDNEELCLLLYQLISQNEAFRSFTLSKFDPELLLLPLLQSLYVSFKEKTNFNKIYTLLITLLIMSQDEIYTETLQKIEIDHPSWFMDNNLKKISLSNFTLIILLKIIQINLVKYKDIYLHSNCLAILANLSIKMDNIHHYAAQKLIGFLELIQKMYTKMKNINKEESNQENNDMELIINEDLIMLLLEIINSCFINSLKTNLQLVYFVMRGKEIINSLKDVERFKEPVENILYTINYFESKIIFEEDLPSSDDIMRQIIQISRSWTPDNLKKSEPIKFKFVEEKDYSLFFLPYIYNIIYTNTLFFLQ
ncbi:hypothetical protein H8356DRAFT_1678057 [Neocallimastix lanati (nom. inval.)]|uniref:Dymeclin n=1 Tax=Neocallimastix californiae TaxID=1754190 RepID=A0A1Y2ABJ6_9FUNG|nr:hypothetical protein H8356DRAFT_1678057 [Neocallimastix sp. JGI-2020a]ORY19933.1 hypothetical protein LY90DRAFT_708105 [Neocallimastix californiae]|eukprot:ORY19933.1 hypothetical protein LY90DRAFT_708105 [Neocallimastix californiae]